MWSHLDVVIYIIHPYKKCREFPITILFYAMEDCCICINFIFNWSTVAMKRFFIYNPLQSPRIQAGELSMLTSFPDEILLKIFSYLPRSNLSQCARVCQHFFRVAMDNSLCKLKFHKNLFYPLNPLNFNTVEELILRLTYRPPCI